MKTVRFTNVVKTCGKPEVYLLLSKDDAEFKRALKAHRIMSLGGGPSGVGTVGYNEKQRGQLLLFPKSLSAFEGSRVVGIKYELFTEEDEAGPRRAAPAKKPGSPKKTESPPIMRPEVKKSPAKPAKIKHTKVIPFPKQARPEEHESISEIKNYVRQALRALEKNKSVAAYKILKNIIPGVVATAALLVP